MPASLSDSVKLLMRSFPQGVTIVTGEKEGAPFGVTVSAFSTVSLDPALVMVSMTKGTRARDALYSAKSFTVNVLSSDQSELAERFAGRSGSRSYDFQGVPVRKGSNGCLVFTTAVGYLECVSWSQHEEGDHTIIVGRVVAAGVDSEASPLVYYRRRYTTVVAPSADAPLHDSLSAEW